MAKENNSGANLGFETELWRAADALRSNMDLSLIHISEPTRLLSISYAVFCLKKKKKKNHT